MINLQRSQNPSAWRKALRAAGVAVLLGAAHAALASNILINSSYEASSGGAVPAGWTYYGSAGGNFWINSDAWAHTGNNYFKLWGANWNGPGDVTGIYQDNTCAPGWAYLADTWFFTLATDAMGPGNLAWVEVTFRDASDNMLALYKTATFNTTNAPTSTWYNFAVTNACDPVSFVVTGAVTQLVAPQGTTKVRYQFVHLHNAWDGGSVYMDDCTLNQVVGPVPPVIASVYPGYMLLVVPTNGIKFNVSSPSSTTIPVSGIHLTLNGADVSGSLQVSGSASNKNVAYYGLQSNLNYTASITITDAQNLTASATFSFDTLNQPVFLWECEDFDFTNGMYINNPVVSTDPANPNTYFGKVGNEAVDEHDIGHNGDKLYRADDNMATTYSGDWTRQKFVDAGIPDYKIGWFDGGEWVNYTRDFPSGNYNIIGRLGGGNGAATAVLSDVTTGTENVLGLFQFVGQGWSTYNYVTLTDTNGNMLAVNLGGHQTLRLTTGGGVDPNFIMLVPAVLDMPVLNSVYPDGTHPFQPTNTFAFTASSPNAPINASGVQLILNGNDVSAAVVIGGTGTTLSGTYTGLRPNVMYTSILSITNTHGRGFSVTNHFDTFSESNFMVEAEDYDYGVPAGAPTEGGQFIDNPAPNGYIGLDALTNVDYQHTFVNGEQFAYRPGLPTQASSDYLRQAFATVGAVDYNIGWFGYPDWANYTRTYPSGSFIVYGRFAGSGGYSMYLDKVISGTGTVNQVTQRLGRWGAVGRGWQNYDWVPLTDEGLSAPVIVKLGGVSTLRISTTGNCNPNYMMLVPVGGITLTATKSGGNVVISFPTTAGMNYRVFYKNELTTGTWTLLTTVAGDGTVKSATDTPTAAHRYYQVIAP